MRRPHHSHSNVGVAPRQILVAVGQHKLDRDARMLGVECGKDRRQHLAADHVACGYPDRSAVGGGFARRRTAKRRGGGRHRFDMRLERRSGGRRRQPARRPREQRQPERCLQRVDVAADGRLGQTEPPRRAGKASVARDLDESAQLVPVRRALSHTKMYS